MKLLKIEGEVMDIQEEREAFEEKFPIPAHWIEFDIKRNKYFCPYCADAAANAYQAQWETWQVAKAQAVPEGFVLLEQKEFNQMSEFEELYRRAIFNSKKSIHEVNWSHVSGLGVSSTKAKAMCKRFNIDSEATFRKTQGPTEMKIDWGMECPKCNHNEAMIHSTAEPNSGYEFMDSDAVVCLKCGNKGEIDARGEDSDITWNEVEAQEQGHD